MALAWKADGHDRAAHCSHASCQGVRKLCQNVCLVCHEILRSGMRRRIGISLSSAYRPKGRGAFPAASAAKSRSSTRATIIQVVAVSLDVEQLVQIPTGATSLLSCIAFLGRARTANIKPWRASPMSALDPEPPVAFLHTGHSRTG